MPSIPDERQITRTTVTCSKCQKPATVPFVPTPGRPVFCRDCFSKTSPRTSGFGGPSGGAGGAGGFRREGSTPSIALPSKKRMMAQGRKTHFLYDAKEILGDMPGGMEQKDNRAFLESLFAKGARGSTQDAQVFLEDKVKDGGVTHEQAIQLGRLIDKYSFYR